MNFYFLLKALYHFFIHPRYRFSINIHKEHIDKARIGDQKAMQQLYNLYAGAMLNTSFRILNCREDAEDALQESFVKAFTSLHQYNAKSTFGAWLKRIVINKSIDILKRKNKNKMIDMEEKDLYIHQDHNALDTEDHNGQLDLLYKALHALPDGYRTIFSLYMIEGYDHKEIGQILGIGVSTSISQLSRAKNKLKGHILKFSTYG